MTGLDLPDSSVGGVLAFHSIMHIPDEAIPAVLAGFHRVIRPGGIAMLRFHIGDERRYKTQGYGGHPMNLYVHRRPIDRMATRGRLHRRSTDPHPARQPGARRHHTHPSVRRQQTRLRRSLSASKQPRQAHALLGPRP
jgi:hypothetical protein